MKEIIKEVLNRHKDGQGNLASEPFREMLAVEIAVKLTSHPSPLTIEMWKGYNPEQTELDF